MLQYIDDANHELLTVLRHLQKQDNGEIFLNPDISSGILLN